MAKVSPNVRPDGSVAYAEVRLGDSVMMIGTPAGEGTTMPAMIHLLAGVLDPFGNQWWIATPIKAAAPAHPSR
jgi:uncharacterized glyoxalase superfamily protein PhnB